MADPKSPPRLVGVTATLGPDTVLVVGPLRVRLLPGLVVVNYRDSVEVRAVPKLAGGGRVVATTDGSMYPQVEVGSPPPEAAEGRDAPVGKDAAPLLRLGPGGDAARDIYPADITDNPVEPGHATTPRKT